MDGDVRSSSDEISDSSVDNPNKAAHLPAVQQNGTPKKETAKANGVSNKLANETAATEN